MSGRNHDTKSLLRGEAVTLRFTVGGEAEPSGAEQHYRIARSASAEALVEVDGGAITSPESGVYEVPLSHEQTSALPAGSLYSELYEVTNGVRTVLSWGAVRVQDAQVARHE